MNIFKCCAITACFMGMGASLALAAPQKALASEDTLAKIAAQIEQHPVFSANFVQTRKMADLKRPLVTTGKMVFARQHGILWKIERPYHIRYFLGEEKVIEALGEGGTLKERRSGDLPGLAQVGRIFRAMLGAKAEALGEYFEVTAQGDALQWEIRLKPRQAQLAQFLSSMRISGAQYVSSIQITEASGDSTQIDFQEAKGAQALSEDEWAEFKALVLEKKK